MRWCNNCETLKPLTEFYRCTRLLHGRGYVCKVCKLAKMNAYYAANRVAVLKRIRDRRVARRETV